MAEEVVYRGKREDVDWALRILSDARIEATVIEDPNVYALQVSKGTYVWHVTVAESEVERAREALRRGSAETEQRVRVLSRHLEKAAVQAALVIAAFVAIEYLFRGDLGVRVQWLGIGWLVVFVLFARRKPADLRTLGPPSR